MIETILIVKALCIAFVITRFQPIQWVMEALLTKTKNNLILLLIDQLLTCLKCCTFWLALLMTGDIFLASVAFIIAFVYDKNLSMWERRVKF